MKGMWAACAALSLISGCDARQGSQPSVDEVIRSAKSSREGRSGSRGPYGRSVGIARGAKILPVRGTFTVLAAIAVAAGCGGRQMLDPSSADGGAAGTSSAAGASGTAGTDDDGSSGSPVDGSARPHVDARAGVSGTTQCSDLNTYCSTRGGCIEDWIAA